MSIKKINGISPLGVKLLILLLIAAFFLFPRIASAEEIIIDNTLPVVVIISPTTANPNYTNANLSVPIIFNYTEANPTNYTITISNYTTVVCTKLNSSLAGGENIRVTDTCTMSNISREGNYNLTVSVSDALGNTSTNTQIDSVIIDLTPPVISSPQPLNNSDVSSPVTFGISTNEIADCRYSQSSGQTFSSMASFTNTNSTTHSSILLLDTFGSYNYFIKCRDNAGNVNPADYQIAFSCMSNYTYFGKSVAMNMIFHIGSAKDDDRIAASRDFITVSGDNVVAGIASSGYGFATNFSKNYSASDIIITLKEAADDNMFLLGFTKGDYNAVKNKMGYLGDKKILSKSFADFTASSASYPIFIRLDYDDADITTRGGWSGSGRLLIRNRGNTDRGIPNITIELVE